MKVTELNQKHIDQLNLFINMSRNVGSMPDYIQSGGGNTSIKIGDMMAVKCSGCQLKEMTLNSGYVLLPYNEIRKIYLNSDRGVSSEKDTAELVNDSLIKFDDLPEKRPSVEAGFHALLGNVVIHSHAIYANIFNCIKDGEIKLKTILNSANIKYLFLPFINPSADLAFAIIDQQNKLGENFPNVIFLKNHGLIVWADTVEEALKLNSTVLNVLKNALELGDYPPVDIIDYGSYCISNNAIIKQMLADKALSASIIMQTPLYPDQLVYLNANLGEANKLVLSDTATYNCTYNAAYSLEETLLAYAYILKVVNDKNLQLDCMPASGIQFILGWDAEKYRQQMLK